MAELRRELECDVREVTHDARVMTDWKFYARKFPWAVAGGALLAGFLLVPKRKPVIKPDPDTIAQLIKQKKIHVESVTQQPDKPGVMKSLLMMGLTWGLRNGLTYATQHIAAAAQAKAAEAAARQRKEPGPSPLHEPWSTSSTMSDRDA